MRAIYHWESFEGDSRKFSKFENENEGNIFESFGIPNVYSILVNNIFWKVDNFEKIQHISDIEFYLENAKFAIIYVTLQNLC